MPCIMQKKIIGCENNKELRVVSEFVSVPAGKQEFSYMFEYSEVQSGMP